VHVIVPTMSVIVAPTLGMRRVTVFVVIVLVTRSMRVIVPVCV
jgi:hypothetical protein